MQDMKSWLTKLKFSLSEAEDLLPKEKTKDVLNVLKVIPPNVHQAENYEEIKSQLTEDKNLWFVVLQGSTILGAAAMYLDSGDLSVQIIETDSSASEILVQTVCSEFRSIENATSLHLEEAEKYKEQLRGKGFLFTPDGDAVLNKG